MIVQRITWKVKMGAEDKAIEMLMPYLRGENYPLRRVYRPLIASGAYGVIAAEFEFENQAELERTWQEWLATEDANEFMPKWNELLESGGSELWELVE